MSATKEEVAKAVAELTRRQRENKLAAYKPYPKQEVFHNAGATARERVLLAGNQQGKSFAVSREWAMHLTGRYPDWFKGRRFTTPIQAWAVGVTVESTRDNPQRLLLGTPGEWGTGAIPREYLGDMNKTIRMARGMSDAVDTVFVNHISGGQSQLGFKAQAKGRESLQGPSLHAVLIDEEPEEDIYSELLARISATKGIIAIAMTPLKGMSSVVKKFLQEPSPDRFHITMDIADAQHIPEEERERIIAGYLPHERDARVRGVPMMGSGRVFQVLEEAIEWQPTKKIPDYWARLAALDFGWDHPTAVVWGAHDRDADTVYIYDCYKASQQIPAVHASAIRARGKWIPMAWPHDGLQHDKGSGEQLAAQYKREGVNMLPNRAQFDDGSNGVEAGIMEMLSRMQTGRLKVAKHLGAWFEEFRLYHRKNGIIVKEFDDLMSATRYLIMDIRHGKTETHTSEHRLKQQAHAKSLARAII